MFIYVTSVNTLAYTDVYVCICTYMYIYRDTYVYIHVHSLQRAWGERVTPRDCVEAVADAELYDLLTQPPATPSYVLLWILDLVY